ncbi:hypothetical protein QR680_009602 [Steinernema hermaphroditum]|uniref:Uncharacterized protein n=1 Tax=Steinernema hermaphroditum TaxID=289476 RepID=A0AA39IM91_9BILA|nr:hypothetical protein QR680_009602 [Steinernema hermaphroditum]
MFTGGIAPITEIAYRKTFTLMHMEEVNGVGVPETEETRMYNVAKAYYSVCKKCTDKKVLLSDSTTSVGLVELLTHGGPKVVFAASKARRVCFVSSDICIFQILLLLTETPELCFVLDGIAGLSDQIAAAAEREAQPKTLRNLLLVQTRIVSAQRELNNKLSQDQSENMKQSFLPVRDSRTVIFKFDFLSHDVKRSIESVLLNIKGVVSLCFDTPQLRIAIRAKYNLSPRDLASAIISCSGMDSIKHIVKNDYGTFEEHAYYAELLESSVSDELPRYLDEDLDVFDSKQCVATQEQVASLVETAVTWFSSVRSLFW